ncbi:GroES-like protein [Ascobolus immersus RN42]|uniref:GroES-like protein n=1 Tax=Ascobolus immersus RN42 TaxID=1160509 RepID=A0A3N4HNK1_ASCIM|nr:GroES-like protein [Ascobolus immersus RN42]
MPSTTATVFKGSSSGKIVKTQEKYDLKPHEILIKIKFCGLCGTDEHYKKADMVLGHEGAGIVEDVGSSVTGWKKGDRAGWGYTHSTCGTCQKCLSGAEIFCQDRAFYGETDQNMGGFASHFPIDARYAFHIPAELPLHLAAPLMCGGATVFSPLYNHVRPTSHVGIIGLGGLGHLAVLFAKKMGCEVTVFSGSDSKKEEALSAPFNADAFFAVKGKSADELTKMFLEGAGGKGEQKETRRKLDCLIVSTSVLPDDLGIYFDILEPQGVILPLTVAGPDEKLQVPYMRFLQGGIKVIGSCIAPRYEHNLMLNFAARNKVHPVVMKFPMTVEGIEEGFKTLEEGKMRYRGVLVAEGANEDE